MIIILFYVLFCFIIILGFGGVSNILIRKYAGYKVESFDELILCGFVSLSLLTGYVSLMFSINYILLSILIALLLCFALSRRKDKTIKKRLSKIIDNQPEAIFFTLTLIFLSLVAAYEIFTFDSGLYHTQNIKWIRTFSVVPGLANFQPQLGFNSMFFPISALFTLDIPSYSNERDILVYPLNIVLFLTVSTRLFSVALKKYESSHFIDSFFYTILLALIFLVLPKHISSPSPDIACTLIIIYIAYLFLESQFYQNRFFIYLIVALSTIVVSYKLSAVMIGLLSIVLLYRSKSILLFYKSTIIALFVIAPYLLRNYYLSGYMIYPFDGIDLFSPDWKVPIESVTFEIGVIKAWARIPGTLKSLNMPITEWFGIWLNHQDLINKLLIFSNALILFVVAYNLFKRNWKMSVLSTIVFFNFFFWFFTAPDTRFAYGFLFLGSALVIRELLSILPFKGFLSKASFLITGVSICCILYFYRVPLSPNSQNFSNIIIPFTYPESEVQNVSIGFNYFKTINGSRCFNHDLPCNTRLTNRGYDIFQRSETIASGFRVEKK